MVFSSPELKAQVKFSDCLLSIVRPSVSQSVNFSQFHLEVLLKNHWANFNQNWHKASLCEGDSICQMRVICQGEYLQNNENTLTK